MRDINTIFSELAQYNNIQNETKAIIDSLQDEIKIIMTETGNYNIIGSEHKASWNEIKQNKFDSTTFKNSFPDIYKEFSKETVYRRFNFS